MKKEPTGCRLAAFMNWRRRLMSRCSILDGISAEDEAVLHEAIAEEAHSSPFLDFVFSEQGIQLNSAFLQIGDRTMRRDVMVMIKGIARVSGG